MGSRENWKPPPELRLTRKEFWLPIPKIDELEFGFQKL